MPKIKSIAKSTGKKRRGKEGVHWDEFIQPQPAGRNKYKVPAKQWRKWPEVAQLTFNETFYLLKENQKLFLWPGDQPRTDRRWRTAAYNAAWVAADAVVHSLDHIIGD